MHTLLWMSILAWADPAPEPPAEAVVDCTHLIAAVTGVMSARADDSQVRAMVGRLGEIMQSRCTEEGLAPHEAPARCVIEAETPEAFQACENAGPDSPFGAYLQFLMGRSAAE